MFDQSGKCIKRSYIGPENYITNLHIDRAMTPTDFTQELKRISSKRKQEETYTQLLPIMILKLKPKKNRLLLSHYYPFDKRLQVKDFLFDFNKKLLSIIKGKHAPSSFINNSPSVRSRKGSSRASFLKIRSPKVRKTTQTSQSRTRASHGFPFGVKKDRNKIVVEEMSNPNLTNKAFSPGCFSNSLPRRRKKTCGCNSAVQVQSPKVSAFSKRPSTCKQQVFQETLKQTRLERNKESMKAMQHFWGNFMEK